LALRNAAAAIEWPDDELSVFATLKGQLFALSDEQLLVYRAQHGPLRPKPLASTTGEVAEALRVLHELHRERNRRPIAETFSRLLHVTRSHAAFAIRPAGEQALGNVLRMLELARRFEAAGASSFRAFVDRLADDAERGDAAEAPVVEEGTEGVRIMSVHKAKGLEFPVVILCDPCAPAVPKMPSRMVDPVRRVWAMPLAGCAPIELLEKKDELLQRDREEVVRVAYVAATRARDLLVVPATGDGELAGWLEALGPAVYPHPEARRQPQTAAGCPPFGKETVLDRPDDLMGELSVSPGAHKPRAGEHEVVWWDPHALQLGRETEGGVRSHDLLAEGLRSQETAEGHARWQASRARALADGKEPSLKVETVTARSINQTAAARPVALEAVAGRDRARPHGKRFGALVHATLAEIPLRATPDEIARAAAAQGRFAGATTEEVQAAALAVQAALSHPLLRRAASSLEVRREEPLLHALPDGTLLEGVVDLAFLEPQGWTVVDFKTDPRPAQPQYEEQLRLYCLAIEAATGKPATAALLAV
jgi:ATP-dependent helicase/nuclease subunit A